MTIYTGASANQGGVIGIPEGASFLPETWVADTIRARQRSFVMANYVMAQPFSGGQGDKIKKPYVGRLRTRRKLPGQPFFFEQKREGMLEMVVDRDTYAAFAIDRKLDIQSNVNLRAEYSKSIGEALAEEVEYALLAERATFISFDAANNRIQSSAPIAYTDMQAAFSRAIELDSDPSEWTWFVGPSHFATMFNIDQFVRANQWNSGDIAQIPSGTVVGTILGSPVVLNQSIRRNGASQLNLGGIDYQDTTSESVTLTATPGFLGSDFMPTQWGSDRFQFPSGINVGCGNNYHSAMLLHRSAIWMAVQLSPEMRTWENNEYGDTRVLGRQIYDIKTIDPQLGIVIETDEDGLI